MTHNTTSTMKSKSLKAVPHSSLNRNDSYQGFPGHGDLSHENSASVSVISRPQPGFSRYLPGSNPVTFEDELLEEQFESFFYKKTRSTEFSWIGKSRGSIIHPGRGA